MFRIYIPEEIHPSSSGKEESHAAVSGSPVCELKSMRRSPKFPHIYRDSKVVATDEMRRMKAFAQITVIAPATNFMKLYSQERVKSRSSTSNTTSTAESASGCDVSRSLNRMRSEAAADLRRDGPLKPSLLAGSTSKRRLLQSSVFKTHAPAAETRSDSLYQTTELAGSLVPNTSVWIKSHRLPPIKESVKPSPLSYLERTLLRAESLRREHDNKQISESRSNLTDKRSDSDSIRSRSVVDTSRSSASMMRKMNRRRIRLKDATDTGIIEPT